MSKDLIRYDLLVQEALRGVARHVLADAARNGLRGDHHFYVTFETGAPGVRLSDVIRGQYPKEMTIILQHQFRDLKVNDQAFEVVLTFKGAPERLVIPFTAVTGFFDPSVQFGLKFESPEDAREQEAGDAPEPAARRARDKPAEKPAKPKPAKDAAKKDDREAPPAAPAGDGAPKVVSIDAFRKKN